jgi:hypothetical protein
MTIREENDRQRAYNERNSARAESLTILPGAVTPLSKGIPRVLEKKLKRAAIEKHRVNIKAEVFKRDDGRCRCCGGHATELHEMRSRGAGGKRSLYNSIAVCGYAGANCHRLIQTHVIAWDWDNEEIGADGPILWKMGSREWHG